MRAAGRRGAGDMSGEDDRRQDLFDKLDDKAKFQWLFNENEQYKAERQRIIAGVYWALGGIGTLILPNIPIWIKGWLK